MATLDQLYDHFQQISARQHHELHRSKLLALEERMPEVLPGRSMQSESNE